MQLQGLPQTRTNHVFRDSEMPESLQGRDKVDWQQRLIRHCQLKPVMIWPQLVALVLTYPTFLWIVHASGALSLLFGFGALSLIGFLPFSAFYAMFTEALPQTSAAACSPPSTQSRSQASAAARSSWSLGCCTSREIRWRRPGICCSRRSSTLLRWG